MGSDSPNGSRVHAGGRKWFVPALVVVGTFGLVALRLWVVEPVTVVTDSMEPTVPRGSLVLIHAVAPSPEDVTVGQMIVFDSPEDATRTLKRVAGTGGQTIAIRDGTLYVDGTRVMERYLDSRQTDGTFFHRVTVPGGYLFVLGDNRASSIDSRDYGFVPLAAVTGTVLWPR